MFINFKKFKSLSFLQMNLTEYAAHCACHLRNAVNEENANDAHGYVLRVLNLAEELELRQLRAYCIWWMQINYDSIHEFDWFNELSLSNREEIVQGQWPGLEYHRQMEAWTGKRGKNRSKVYSAPILVFCLILIRLLIRCFVPTGNPKENKNCAVQ